MYLAVLAMVIGQAILLRSFLLLGYALLVWGGSSVWFSWRNPRYATSLGRAMKPTCTPFHDGFLVSSIDDVPTRPVGMGSTLMRTSTRMGD